MEPASNKGIFTAQVKPFRSLGYEPIIFYAKYSITRNLQIRKVNEDEFCGSVFSQKIALPVISIMGLPSPISYLWLCLIALWNKDIKKIVRSGSKIRIRSLLLPSILRFCYQKNTDVVDVRGIMHDEARLMGRKFLTVQMARIIECHGINASIRLTAPTSGVASYLRRISKHKNIIALPPYTYGEFRSQKSITEAIKPYKVVFLGTLSAWNNKENFKQLLSKYPTITSVCLLGADQSTAEAISKEIGIMVTHKRVQHEDVFSELQAYKFGVVLGSVDRYSLTDRTMVPSKLYEYLEAGLVPIIPSNCKSSKKFMNKEKLEYLEF